MRGAGITQNTKVRGNTNPNSPYGGLPIALRRLTPSCARYLRLRYDYLRKNAYAYPRVGHLEKWQPWGGCHWGLCATIIATVIAVILGNSIPPVLTGGIKC